MSTCISRHGEYSSHTPDADYVCTLCFVLDEDGLIAELTKARAENALMRPVVEAATAWHDESGDLPPADPLLRDIDCAVVAYREGRDG